MLFGMNNEMIERRRKTSRTLSGLRDIAIVVRRRKGCGVRRSHVRFMAIRNNRAGFGDVVTSGKFRPDISEFIIKANSSSDAISLTPGLRLLISIVSTLLLYGRHKIRQ